MARIDGLMYGDNPRNGYFESTASSTRRLRSA